MWICFVFSSFHKNIRNTNLYLEPLCGTVVIKPDSIIFYIILMADFLFFFVVVGKSILFCIILTVFLQVNNIFIVVVTCVAFVIKCLSTNSLFHHSTFFIRANCEQLC